MQENLINILDDSFYTFKVEKLQSSWLTATRLFYLTL